MRNHFAAALLALLLILAISASGAPKGHGPKEKGQHDNGQKNGPPARVSDLRGRLAVHGPDEEAPSYVDRNAVIRPGDTLWTDDHGRAEVEVGRNGWLRLGEDTKVEVRSIGPSCDYRLWNGSLYYDGTRGVSEAAWIRTPEGDLEAEPGCVTRVEVINGNSGRCSVYRGRARLYAEEGGPVYVPSDQRVFLESGRISAGPQPFRLTELDDFDRYERSRVDYYGRRPYLPDVEEDIVGVRDLNDYGGWVSHHGSRYWHPRYRRGWRPYSRGYWSYVSGYGYNWVDDEPWGYCTSHYGRWAYYQDCGGWCWDPDDDWAPCHTRWCSYDNYYGWAPLDRWDRPVTLVGGFIGGGALFAGVALDFGSWTFCPRDDFYYCRPALLSVGAFGFGGGYPYYTGDRIRINNTSIRNVTYVNNVYDAVGVPRDPVRGLVVGRDGAFARSTVARVETRIPRARAASIQDRFGIPASRDRALAQRASQAERIQRDPRSRLNAQAVVRGAQGGHAFRASAAAARQFASNAAHQDRLRAAQMAGRAGAGGGRGARLASGRGQRVAAAGAAAVAGAAGVAAIQRRGAARQQRLTPHEQRLAAHQQRLAARQQRLAGQGKGALAGNRAVQNGAAGRQQRLTPHEQRLAAHQQRLAAHQQRLAARTTNARGRNGAAQNAAAAGHQQRLAARQKQLTGHQQRLAAHQQRLSGHQQRLAARQQRTTAHAMRRPRMASRPAPMARSRAARPRFAQARPMRARPPRAMARRAGTARSRAAMSRPSRAFRAPRQARVTRRAAPREFRMARGPSPRMRERVSGSRAVFRASPRRAESRQAPRARQGGGGGGGGRSRPSGGRDRPGRRR